MIIKTPTSLKINNIKIFLSFLFIVILDVNHLCYCEQYNKIEELEIAVNGKEIFSINKLTNEKLYMISISGTFEFSDGSADPFFYTDYLGNYTNEGNFFVLDNGNIKYKIIESDRSSHFYKITFIGNGKKLSIRTINDYSYYSSNKLSVILYEISEDNLKHQLNRENLNNVTKIQPKTWFSKFMFFVENASKAITVLGLIIMIIGLIGIGFSEYAGLGIRVTSAVFLVIALYSFLFNKHRLVLAIENYIKLGGFIILIIFSGIGFFLCFALDRIVDKTRESVLFFAPATTALLLIFVHVLSDDPFITAGDSEMGFVFGFLVYLILFSSGLRKKN